MSTFKYNLTLLSLFALLFTGCSEDKATPPTTTKDPGDTASVSVPLTDENIEDLVRRSYQYVAMYNVNNKFAL